MGRGTQSQLRFCPNAIRISPWLFSARNGALWAVSPWLRFYCLFLLAIFSTAVLAKDRFGSMLVVGVFFIFSGKLPSIWVWSSA